MGMRFCSVKLAETVPGLVAMPKTKFYVTQEFRILPKIAHVLIVMNVKPRWVDK